MTTDNSQQLKEIVQRALVEDVGDGDITSLATLPLKLTYSGQLIAKAEGIVAGLAVAQQSFALVDKAIQFEAHVAEGTAVSARQSLARIYGPAQSILTAERVALNFLQRMSGIATLTHQFVTAVAHTKATILDTRKTVPGLRYLDKWAVRLGRGQNHRMGLYDMVLIKDNHITAAGGITQAVQRVRVHDERQRPIEVEVKSLRELAEALPLNVDRIMLDNMSLMEMREAVKMVKGRVPLEASGNVSLETVAAIAETGVDYISSGMLTHSVPALDISFLFDS